MPNASTKLPEGWRTVRVRDLILRHVSGPSPTCEEREVHDAREWGLLKTTAVTWNGWNESAHKVLPEQYWGSSHLEVHAGDVIVTKAGPRHRVGVVARVTSTRPRLIVSGKMVLLEPDTRKVLPEVLAEILAERSVQTYFDSRKSGMAESQVNFTNLDLLDAQVRVPSLAEQYQIKEIIEALDVQVSTHERVLKKLRLIEQGAIARAMQESWSSRQVQLNELTTLIIDGVHHAPDYQDSGVPFVTVENLTRGSGISLDPVRYVTARDHLEFSRRAAPSRGDILVSKDGTLGVARVVEDGLPEFSIFVSVALLRPNRELLNSHYGRMFFDSPQFLQQLGRLSSGTGLKHIHLGEFRQFVLNVPPLGEQVKLVGSIAAIRDSIRAEEQGLSRLARVRAGLIGDLLAGRTRVTPRNDEVCAP